MSTVIEFYNIKFYKKLLSDQTPFYVMSSVNETLSNGITDYYQVDDVDEFLLRPVNDIIGGIVASPQMLVSESVIMFRVGEKMTNLYSDPHSSPGDSPDFSLPTSHLKEIIIFWRNFLQNNN